MLARRTLLATAAALPFAAPWGARAQNGPAKQDDTTSRAFQRDVVIRWGDRVAYDSPPFTPDAPSEAAAAGQFGWDAMLLGVVPVPQGEDGVPRALLAVAHPTAEARMMFPGGIDRPVDAVLAQGASILNLERHGANWLVTDGGYQSRRIHGRTLCRVQGPAASIIEAAIGVLSVQAGGVTPWGSVLMAEGDPAPWFGRLGDRDATLPRRQNAQAYGWLVELDPFDPQAMPTKRTALGRFPRSGVAATRTGDGRAVVFMSDDRPGGHLFRFVSADPVGPDNPDALDRGTLSVAVLDGYTLRWTALPDAVTTPMATLDSASRLGAARFERPAGLAIDAQGTVLLACRGNGGVQIANAANFGAGTPDGHVLVLRPTGGDPAAERFSAEVGLIGGDTGFGGATVSRPSSLSIGADGRIWIATDASSLAVAAPGFGPLTEVYRPPVGALMGGVGFSPDGTVVFSGVRHPGATPGASFDRPATRWPTLRRDMPPQSVIVGLSRT